MNDFFDRVAAHPVQALVGLLVGCVLAVLVNIVVNLLLAIPDDRRLERIDVDVEPTVREGSESSYAKVSSVTVYLDANGRPTGYASMSDFSIPVSSSPRREDKGLEEPRTEVHRRDSE